LESPDIALIRLDGVVRQVAFAAYVVDKRGRPTDRRVALEFGFDDFQLGARFDERHGVGYLDFLPLALQALGEPSLGFG
jgi:hypothetical protein